MNDECKLISIDIDSDITETFRLCLENEQNNRNIEIINKDLFDYSPVDKFDIITMIGSTVQEIGLYKETFNKVSSMLTERGEVFYSCVDRNETRENLLIGLKDTELIISDYQRLEKYGLVSTDTLLPLSTILTV